MDLVVLSCVRTFVPNWKKGKADERDAFFFSIGVAVILKREDISLIGLLFHFLGTQTIESIFVVDLYVHSI